VTRSGHLENRRDFRGRLVFRSWRSDVQGLTDDANHDPRERHGPAAR
jgi:hypothetical protein